ncbi:amidophosphoribosyltransferase [Aquibacillus albus]|uniref:Amidophosphoribosyltransferase n=1 Tax=Aquibacillus albus TaxID=1168171 RepID=A0ABS2MVR1_9BACI|nr:amidophosphoribosyltransferase [Aquibacillus albus]MBM7569989.1 amidophosphoribosyltransferase [Aquibacillus albus]
MSSEMKEKCGVFGIFNHPQAADLTYYGLHALQHRGQESAGIAVSDGKRLKHHHGMGLVNQAFSRDILDKMDGNMAIGHVRYSTSGESLLKNAQPLVFNYSKGDLAVAHNGNLVNARIERDVLQQQGSIFQTTTDTEVIAHLIARSKKQRFEHAAPDILSRIDGSFALVIMTENQLLIALDRHGLRPLSLGKIGDDAIVASSETCAFNAVGAKFWRDVEPGEWILINENGIETGRFAKKEEMSLCSFEFVYFARPDSVIRGRSVLSIRKELGETLAKEHPVEADVVVAVPESSIPSALGYAHQLDIPYEMGLIKNPYAGRSFIEPTQELRELAVRLKLSAVEEIIEGKRVVLIDDSIVRGTTIKRIVKLIQDAGAKEVHVRISSPMVRNPCFYGVDMPTKEEMLANRHEQEQAMGETIGADSLAFLSTDGLLEAVNIDLAETNQHCIACFSGAYPTHLYLD